MKKLLRFVKGNAKLKQQVYILNLPAGYTCPGANTCWSKARKSDGKIQDGPNSTIRCYAASEESRYPSVRKMRWGNLNLLRNKTEKEMHQLLEESLPSDATIVRVHSSGDFFNSAYFRAWMQVAKTHPKILFYAYTKSILAWLLNKHLVPKNFILTASLGSKYDAIIIKKNLKRAEVVLSKREVRQKELVIDHDDHCARTTNPKRFAFLIHGIQPAGTPAAAARSKLKKQGWNGYSRISLKMAA